MENFEGNLRKMKVQDGDPIRYTLNLDYDDLPMNDLIGEPISLTFNGRINCMACGNTTNKSFGNGFCYPCMIKSPLNSECIIRPELCRAHLGEGRDPEWEKENHLQPHVVYLALSSGLKVGVTRASQVPTRWIDQGAWKAIYLSETPNRYIAGMIETNLKQHISDKTNWQKMLRNIKAAAIDLKEKKNELNQLLPQDLQQYMSDRNDIHELNYPVERYPQKIKSVNFDKVNEISGKLTGIKGQYLIFEDDRVINIRRHNGYHISLNI